MRVRTWASIPRTDSAARPAAGHVGPGSASNIQPRQRGSRHFSVGQNHGPEPAVELVKEVPVELAAVPRAAGRGKAELFPRPRHSEPQCQAVTPWARQPCQGSPRLPAPHALSPGRAPVRNTLRIHLRVTGRGTKSEIHALRTQGTREQRVLWQDTDSSLFQSPLVYRGV